MDRDLGPQHPIAKIADSLLLAAIFALALFLVWLPRVGLEIEQQDRILRIVAAALCLAFGIVLVQVRGLRREILVMEDLLQDVRFGAGTKRDRDAVDILVRALRTPDARAREAALRTLRKISGQDLGEDPAAWESWWNAARATFTRGGTAPAKK